MKKYLFILVPSIIIVSVIIVLKFPKKETVISKFYLEDKYYDNNKLIDIDASTFNKLKNENYLLFTYNNYCAFQIPCEDIFELFAKEQNIAIVSMAYDEFKKTKLSRTVKYAPSVLIVKNGKIVTYLDAEKDEDIPKYQDVVAFTDWVMEYIYLNKEKR